MIFLVDFLKLCLSICVDRRRHVLAEEKRNERWTGRRLSLPVIFSQSVSGDSACVAGDKRKLGLWIL